MPALYDLMLMLDPNAPEERQQEILENVRSAIDGGANLVGVHDWGTRRLAYEIDHRAEAAYHLFQFESDPPLLERLDHSLKITDGVLRFRIIRLKPGAPPPPPPRAAGERPGAARERREGRGEDEQVAPRTVADAPAG